MRRPIRLAVFPLSIVGIGQPALAQEVCTLDAEEMEAPIGVTIAFDPGRSALSYNTGKTGTVSRNPAGVTSYLTRAGEDAPWQFHVVYDPEARNYRLMDDVVLVAGDTLAPYTEETATAQFTPKGGVFVSTFDAEELLAVAGELKKLRLAYRRVEKDGGLSLRRYSASWLDVAQLRSQIGWLGYLEAVGKAEPGRCSSGPLPYPSVLAP